VKKGDAQYLGMLNGDVIKTVNGYSLGSTTELAIAYAALDGAKKLTVKFKRDGATLTHVFKIVD
jgi:S1-C subfamily serine protease